MKDHVATNASAETRRLEAHYEQAYRQRCLRAARKAFRGAWRDEGGYSLMEIMIVIAIIGILALIALPNFMGVTVKAKMTEAKTMLSQVHTLQEAHRYERDVYAKDLRALGFEQQPLVTEEGTARYRITIEEAGAQTFAALATSVVDFDGDGQMNVWEVGPGGKITERTPD